MKLSACRLLPFVALLPALPACGDELQVNFGSEYFVWREHDNGRQLLEETGPRYFIGLDASNRRDQWSYLLNGRLYTGQVAYDGQTQSGTPVRTDTDYSGWSAEMRFAYAFDWRTAGAAPWGMIFGGGFDSWRRTLRDNAGVYGYEEDYQIAYGRFGMTYSRPALWNAEFGLKRPIATSERVGLSRFGYDDVTLRPEPMTSLYASVSYTLAPRWSLIGYYDSYHFAASPIVPITIGGSATGRGAYQPESTQDTYGLQLQYRP